MRERERESISAKRERKKQTRSDMDEIGTERQG
jgi:hypothetical protein